MKLHWCWLISLVVGAYLPAGTQDVTATLHMALHRYPTDLQSDQPLGMKIPELGGEIDNVGRAWANWVVEQLNRGVPPSELTASFASLGSKGELRTEFQLRQEARVRDWLLLSLTLPVPCGSHSVLALFQVHRSNSKLVMLDLRDRQVPGTELGARENLQVRLLEGPRVLVAATPPWCTSCWSRIDLRVVGPGRTAGHPRLLKKLSVSAYRCEDYVFRIEPAEKQSFRIHYFSWAGPEKIIRPAVMVFKGR